MLWKGRGWQTRRGTPLKRDADICWKIKIKLVAKPKRKHTNKAEILRPAWFFLMINVDIIKLLSWQKTFLASLQFAKRALKSLDHVVNGLDESPLYSETIQNKLFLLIPKVEVLLCSDTTRLTLPFCLFLLFFFLKIKKGHDYTKTNIRALFIKRKYNRSSSWALRNRMWPRQPQFGNYLVILTSSLYF